MREEFKDVYKNFAEKYGLHSQIQQCIEEMGELIKELCKYERYINSDKIESIESSVKEEIAEVLNMVEQLEFCFGETEIEKIRTELLMGFVSPS